MLFSIFLLVASSLFTEYPYFAVIIQFLSGGSTIRANIAWVIAGEEQITHRGQTEIIPADMNRANTDSLGRKKKSSGCAKEFSAFLPA